MSTPAWPEPVREPDWPADLDVEPAWPDGEREPDWLAPPPEPVWSDPELGAASPDVWPEPEPGARPPVRDILDLPVGTSGPLRCGCDAATVCRIGDHGPDCRRIT